MLWKVCAYDGGLLPFFFFLRSYYDFHYHQVYRYQWIIIIHLTSLSLIHQYRGNKRRNYSNKRATLTNKQGTVHLPSRLILSSPGG